VCVFSHPPSFRTHSVTSFPPLTWMHVVIDLMLTS
jgi:hypothetical protein